MFMRLTQILNYDYLCIWRVSDSIWSARAIELFKFSPVHTFVSTFSTRTSNYSIKYYMWRAGASILVIFEISKVMCMHIHTYCKFHAWWSVLISLCMHSVYAIFHRKRFILQNSFYKIPLRAFYFIQSRLQCKKQEERLNQIKVYYVFHHPNLFLNPELSLIVS